MSLCRRKPGHSGFYAGRRCGIDLQLILIPSSQRTALVCDCAVPAMARDATHTGSLVREERSKVDDSILGKVKPAAAAGLIVVRGGAAVAGP